MESRRSRAKLKQKRKKKEQRYKIIVTAVVACLVVGIAGLAAARFLRGIRPAPDQEQTAGVAGTEVTIQPEDGDALAQLEEAFHWNLRVTDGADQVAVPDYVQIKEQLQTFVAELGRQWNQSPQDSQAESYDRTTGTYTYSQERAGRRLDEAVLVDELWKAIEEGRLDAAVEAPFAEEAPKRTQQQAKEQYRVIGNYTTKTTDNKNRNQNIRLAAEAIDGMVLKPGEEFSFNMATGNRTSEKGYQPAGAYKNGILVEEPGGGVCQVSTTLYHAIIRSGFGTTERNAHSFAPSYVEKGQDAMVSFDGYAGPDLKFINHGTASVVLRASFSGRELKMSVVGLPLLDEGVEVSIRSEKVRDVEPVAVTYEENPELAFGTEKVVDPPTPGSVWKSYRVIRRHGEMIEEKPLHNSSYKPKSGLIQRNTTVPDPVEAETPAMEIPAFSEILENVENQENTENLENTPVLDHAPGQAETPEQSGGPGV